MDSEDDEKKRHEPLCERKVAQVAPQQKEAKVCQSFLLSSLPEDTIQLLFSFLSLKDLLRLSETSTGWKVASRRTRTLSTSPAEETHRDDSRGSSASSSAAASLFSPDRRSRFLYNNDKNSRLRARFEQLRQPDLGEGFRVWAERLHDPSGTTSLAPGSSDEDHIDVDGDYASRERELRRLCWLPLVLNDMFAHLTCLKLNGLAPYQLRALTIVNQCASAATLVELELRDCRFLCPTLRLHAEPQTTNREQTQHQQLDSSQRQRLLRPRLKRPRPRLFKSVARPLSNRSSPGPSSPSSKTGPLEDPEIYYDDDDDDDYDADNVGLRLRNNNGRLRHFVLSGCVFTFNTQPDDQFHQHFLESFCLQPGLETLVLNGYRTLEDSGLASALAERKKRNLLPLRHVQLIRCSQLRQPNLLGTPTSSSSSSDAMSAPPLALLETLVMRESPNLQSLWPVSALTLPLSRPSDPPSSISSNAIQNQSLSSFAHLHHVDVSFCPELTTETVESLLLNLGSLRTLLLRGCAKLSHVRASSSLSLQELDVTLCPNLTALELQDCDSLQKLEVGHCLTLESVSVSSKSVSHKLNLSCLKSLERLVLCLPSLVRLDLSGCESLTEDETILMLGPSLREVNLCGSLITRNAIKVAVEKDEKSHSSAASTRESTVALGKLNPTGTEEMANVETDGIPGTYKNHRRPQGSMENGCCKKARGDSDPWTVILHETGQPTRYLPIV